MENRTASSQDLLEVLVKGQRKALRHSRIVTLICLVLAALLVIVVLTTVPRITAALDRIDDAFSSVENSLGMLDRLDTALTSVEGAVGKLDGLTDAFSAVESAMGKLDGLADTLSTVESTMGKLDGLAENAEALGNAAARLEEMDIDSLNRGIRNISLLYLKGLCHLIDIVTLSGDSYRGCSHI